MREFEQMADWKINAKKKRTRQLIVNTWVQILELYPERAAAIHMVNVMRSKGNVTGTKPDGSPKYRDPYFITDEEMVKILENYRDELDREALDSLQIDEE